MTRLAIHCVDHGAILAKRGKRSKASPQEFRLFGYGIGGKALSRVFQLEERGPLDD